jgi:uncharacterized protein (DUF58 family)
MKLVRINLRACGLYLFGFVIVYLAGMSMAGVLQYLFLVYLLFPALSFLLLFMTFLKFRYYEHFSTEHPYKGEEVKYDLSLANELPFGSAFVDVSYKIMSPDASLHLNRLTTSLSRGKTQKHSYSIRFPYRGIYEVGIESIELFDVFRWLIFSPQVWFRTFYVYPRIIRLTSVFSNLQNIIETSGTGLGIIHDHTLFRDLAEYRNGGPVKHIAWKKFASLGTPFLKEYEKTSWPGVEIYLDLRRGREPDHEVLEREDCSVEILTALVNYFLSNSVPTSVHAYNGRDRYDFHGDSGTQFAEFYKSTITLTFANLFPPTRVFQSDLHDRRIKAGTVIFITHQLDPSIIGLIEQSTRSDLAIFTIVNQSGMAEEDRLKDLRLLQSHVTLKQNIIFVGNIESLPEDLARQ